MSYQSLHGSYQHGCHRSRSEAMKLPVTASPQPPPSGPGITKRMVRRHARHLFRDKWDRRPLTSQEWWLAEQDLIRCLEADAL